MKKVSISGSLRENVGKKDAKKLRKEGKVICVVYGGKEQIHFTIENNDFNKLIHTPNVYIVDVKVDGKVIPTILQDVQYHPVTDNTLHADFLQLTDGKPLIMNLPVKIEGTSPGIVNGGVLNKKLRHIPVKGLIGDMPENFVIDISSLQIHDTIQVRDIDFGKLTPMLADGLLVVGVKTQRGVVDEDEEEEGEEGEEGEGEEGEASSEEAKAE
ncbi:MAG: 50S ribosomal protein L25 [Bacteroidales bacterium]|nr:50S ribosomal protein L25 [Bacteroidales bacterium]